MDIVTNNIISTHWYDQNEVVRWYHNFMVILTGRMFCPPNIGFEWIWDTIYMSSDQAVWEADWLLSLNRLSRRSNIKMTNEVKNGILQISEGSTACYIRRVHCLFRWWDFWQALDWKFSNDNESSQWNKEIKLRVVASRFVMTHVAMDQRPRTLANIRNWLVHQLHPCR